MRKERKGKDWVWGEKRRYRGAMSDKIEGDQRGWEKGDREEGRGKGERYKVE